MAAACLVLWAGVAISGTRDMLAFNEACAAAAREVEATGVPAWEIDAGYPLNGWRLYAHSENLPPGSDRRYDVPFVTSDRPTQYAIMEPAAAGIRHRARGATRSRVLADHPRRLRPPAPSREAMN